MISTKALRLSADSVAAITVGLVVSFIVAIVVVRWLIGFVSRHGFSVFAWYRIVGGYGGAGCALRGVSAVHR